VFHTRAVNARKWAIFQQHLLLNSVSYVPWEQKNMILNLEEWVNFAIWPGIAPQPRTQGILLPIKISSIWGVQL
jgi:hypothetical protein